MKRNIPLYIAAWFFLLLLSPFLLLGFMIAIPMFITMTGFKWAAKLMQAWADKI